MSNKKNGNMRNNKKNIPTAQDFAKASQLMEEKSRNLDVLRESVLRQFKLQGRLHDFYILDQRDVDFRAYVFFEKTADIEVFKNNGLIDSLVNYVYLELENLGRGKRDEIKVAFEFDSDENVILNYENNYYLRLK